jgi:transcriptional regulator with XRE-family HTH domain
MSTKRRSPSKLLKPGQYDALRELGRFGDSPTFGELIKSLRTCDDISQIDLATRLGISKQHLSAIENGKKAVSPARAVRFAEAMNYPADQFVIAAIEDELRDAGVLLRFDLRKALSA